MDDPARTPLSSAEEELAAVDERHLREARLLQAKALEALRRMPLRTAAQAVAALDRGIRLERLVLAVPARAWPVMPRQVQQGRLW